MSWLQLTIEIEPEWTDPLMKLLEKFDAISINLSVTSRKKILDTLLEHSQSANIFEQHKYSRKPIRLTALLSQAIDLDILIACMRNLVGAGQMVGPEVKILSAQDPKVARQPDYGVKIFAGRLGICPEWCDLPQGDLTYVMLKPGLAFGTGSHETTSACLQWLVKRDLQGKSVIDYGCGSGILALAAAKLGAAKIYAVDIDPQALQTTKLNAELNEISNRLIIAHPDNIDLPVVDILLANLLLEPLRDLAMRFAGLVRTTGDLVLSGLLAPQTEPCLAAYQDWFNMDPPIYRQEWGWLHGTKKPALNKSSN